MMDLHNLADVVKQKVMNDDGSPIFEFPLLNGTEVSKLQNDYLKGYNLMIKEICPDNPFSSYYVAVSGGQKNA